MEPMEGSLESQSVEVENSWTSHLWLVRQICRWQPDLQWPLKPGDRGGPSPPDWALICGIWCSFQVESETWIVGPQRIVWWFWENPKLTYCKNLITLYANSVHSFNKLFTEHFALCLCVMPILQKLGLTLDECWARRIQQTQRVRRRKKFFYM